MKGFMQTGSWSVEGVFAGERTAARGERRVRG